MILKCTSFEGMQREIVGRDMSIVVFGAGAIGTATVPEILRRYFRRRTDSLGQAPDTEKKYITCGSEKSRFRPACRGVLTAGKNIVPIMKLCSGMRIITMWKSTSI